MARDFDGTDDYLSAATDLGVTANPFTFALWANLDDEANIHPLMMLYKDGDEYTLLQARGDTGGDPITIFTRDPSTNATASRTDYAASVWSHMGGKVDTASRIAYLDGVAGTPATTSVAISAHTSFAIFGNLDNGAEGNGKGAEAAVWSSALDASEMAALAKGFSPLLIKLSTLVGYWPILGNDSPERPRKGTVELTVTGTSAKYDHPRVIMPFGLC
jgi:hypothetical protein